VKAPRRPIVRNILVSSLITPLYSEIKRIELKIKLPYTFTVNVPNGNVVAPFWAQPLIRYLRIAL